MHLSRFVFMPVCDRSIAAPVHAVMLFIEVQAILLLQSSLHTRGLVPQALQHSSESHAALVIPKRQIQFTTFSTEAMPPYLFLQSMAATALGSIPDLQTLTLTLKGLIVKGFWGPKTLLYNYRILKGG